MLTRNEPLAPLHFLDHDPFDLVQADLVGGSVVELRCPRGFMRCDLLGVLECAAVLQVGGDAGPAERVAANRHQNTCGTCSAADHLPCLGLRQASDRQWPAHRAPQRSEDRTLALLADVGDVEVDVEIPLKRVVNGNLVVAIQPSAR